MTAGVRRVRGAAVALPAAGEPGPGPEAHVVREVARRLGSTEAVARESYIDPRVFRLYERG